MIEREEYGAALDPALAPARDYLRVEGTGQDEGIAGLIAAAVETCEAFTGLALIAREMRERVAAGGEWRRLGATPVAAVTGVAGEDGAPLPAAAYAIDIDGNGDGWVRVSAPTGPVTVTYRAGLATGWEALPPGLRQGALRLAAHLFAARDRDDATGGGPPAAVAALWRPWRRMRLR